MPITLKLLALFRGSRPLTSCVSEHSILENCNAEIPCLLGLSHALCAWLQFEPAALGSFLSPLEEFERKRLCVHTATLYYRENWKSGKEKRKCSQKFYICNCLGSYFRYDTSHHQIVSYLDWFCLPWYNKEKEFTIMSNHHLRNQKLTLKAVGLMSKILGFVFQRDSVKNWNLLLLKWAWVWIKCLLRL